MNELDIVEKKEEVKDKNLKKVVEQPKKVVDYRDSDFGIYYIVLAGLIFLFLMGAIFTIKERLGGSKDDKNSEKNKNNIDDNLKSR